ncbi:MAG: hypothetical protein KBB09_07080, partial [Firmicutes bacterium]|nr:hypothetical protein [Bacillota bacterium]
LGEVYRSRAGSPSVRDTAEGVPADADASGGPKETIGIMQGVIILIVAAEGVVKGWLPVRRILGTDRRPAAKEVGKA